MTRQDSRNPYVTLVLTWRGGYPPPRTYRRRDLVGVTVRTALGRVRKEQESEGWGPVPPYRLNGAEVKGSSSQRLAAGDKLTLDPVPVD